MERRFFHPSACLIAIGLLLASSLHAVLSDPTWSPTAGSGSFNTPSNWNDNAVPSVNSNLIFGPWSNAPEPATITLSSSYNALSLSFQTGYAGYSFATSNGSILGLGSGGITADYSGFGLVEFTSSLPLALLANQTWTVNGSTELAVHGVISGAFNLTKSGTGKLTLDGANTFSGGLTLSGGTLFLAASSTKPASVITSGPVGTGTLTFDASSTLPTLKVGDTTQLLHNPIVLTGGYGVNVRVGVESSSAQLSLLGIISGSSSINKQGPGTLVLSGANTFSGGVFVDYGTLLLGTSSVKSGASIVSSPVGIGTLSLYAYTTLGVAPSAGPITLHNNIAFVDYYDPVVDTSNGNLTLLGTISGPADLTKTGSGALTLSGNNTYSGDTYLNAGTLFLGSSSAIHEYEAPFYIDSSPFGKGTLWLAETTNVSAAPGSNITLYNTIGFTGNASIGQTGTSDQIRFDSKYDLPGGLAADYSNTVVTINGGVVTLAAATSSNINTFVVQPGAALVFAFQSALPASAINSAAGSYVGISNGILSSAPVGFTNSTAVSDLFLRLNGSTFAGTLGLDSENPLSPATFTGTFDFRSFSQTTFGGLSTLTSGILATSADIYGASNQSLRFSALNGGTLVIDAPLYSAHNITNVIIGRSDGLGNTGTVILTNSGNNYTGGTTLQSGTLTVGSNTALGTGTLTVPSNASANVTFNTVGGNGLTVANALNVAYTTGTAGVRIGGDFDFTLSGAISGAGIIDKYSTDTLTLTGDNSSFTGAINILNGALTLASNKAGGSGTSTIGVIGSGGSSTLKINTPALIIGTLYAYSGTSIILDSSSALTVTQTWDTNVDAIISGTGSLTKAGTNSLTLTGANTYTGGTVVNAGTLYVGADSNLGATAGGLGFGGGKLQVSSDFTSSRAIALNTGGGTFITAGHNLSLAGAISGIGSLAFQGNGNITLAGASTYTGGTTITSSTVLINADNNLGATASGVTLNGGNLFLLGTIPTFTHAIFVDGVGSSFNNNGYNTTLSGVISGISSIAFYGDGTVTFDAANTNSGATSVFNNGTLRGGMANALSASSQIFLSNTAKLDITFNQSIAGLSSSFATTSVTLASGKTLTVAGSPSTTFAGAITGSGALVKSGSSALVLSGANTYSGGTTVSGGSLIIGGGGPTGSITGNVVNNATLAFNRSDSTSYSGVISGTGSLSKQGTGTLSLNAQNTYTGSTYLSGGTLTIGVANALPVTTQLALASSAILDVLNNQTIAGFLTNEANTALLLGSGTIFTVAMPIADQSTTFSGSVSGAGVFAVSGAGNDVVNLTGSVTNTGGTLVGTGATLVIGTGGSVTGPITTTGTLSFNNPGTQTFNNTISGTGGLLVSAGTTTLSGNNTYSGPTNINGGKLIITGNNTGGGTINVGSGAIFGGTGSTTGPLILNSGATVSPGASPGTLSVGATTFAGGANFTFEINNAIGTAGTNWDLLSISGALTISANAGNPFILNLSSLTTGNTAGLLTNFNAANSYQWLFVTASGGITGFSAGAFQYNASQFQNSLNGGSFFVSSNGTDTLFLNFSPVPEPSTYALLALGLGVIVVLSRRRRS